MTRHDATKQVLAAKDARGLTYEEIARHVGRHAVWVAAALQGQATMSEEEASAVGELLGLDGAVQQALQQIPTRGALETAVPVDPLLYRFYEVIQVYGPAMKAIIHEMFGDGIMSAIDFSIDIRRQPDPKGDRVVVELNGKFLPYKKW